MTILKTYALQIDYEDGNLDHVERKGKTAEDVLKRTQEEFPEAYYVSVTGRTKIPKRKRFWLQTQTPVFQSGRHRFGQYIYRHKGRKAPGRKNYQGNEYRQPPPLTVTWTEKYSHSTMLMLKEWMSLALPPF